MPGRRYAALPGETPAPGCVGGPGLGPARRSKARRGTTGPTRQDANRCDPAMFRSVKFQMAHDGRRSTGARVASICLPNHAG
jgi:hypothetical protein